MATLKELQNTVDADMARAVDHGAESTVPLAELMREALFLVEANHRNVGQWRRQTQDALRMIDNGSRAVMGYADALRARREERFDVSA
jgi:hypothetical protein